MTPSWQDSFKLLLVKFLGKDRAELLSKKYQPLLTADYQALIAPRYAIKDILHIEKLATSNAHCINLLNPYQNRGHYRLHFYSREERYLDEYIPTLENLQLRIMDQVQFSICIDGITSYIKSFTIKAVKSDGLPFYRIRKRLLTAIQALMDGKAENDALNNLLVLNGMAWYEIDVLRAYRNYFLQLGLQTTRASIHHALIANPQVALFLFNYFEARFRPNPDWDDPVIREEQALFPLRLQLLESMVSVSDINDDRILRTLFNLIDATMRSNYHQRFNASDYFIALKINSLGIIEMPVPRPQFEIFVHAVDMQGIHLRAGRVSRGGIRWSDRPDDFRTEILGLMQTQVSKNALIIPTGAKGGFVVKKYNGNIDVKAAGKKAYITLINALLELSDNYRDDNVVVRKGNLVAYDDPDPYLVVAADKGTAKFSDIANAISAEHEFWLGDAFASGGSRGYDHKALGITARGAFECIKRHFREQGKDIENEVFSVIGIGSMDGDVFGNGMLFSRSIRLLAAFSGQHIFIDPDPLDSDAAFNERQRLFNLPGSSWNDYDRGLISAGGGVYSRFAKDIPVSAELKKWLGLRYKTLDGESLIRYILTASVELLWLGGIGTYVKASIEKHEDVGDHANDNVRVNAAEIRALIVGEGANLGFTQKARIEYAIRGGRINTDAIDNSAGVDTSDHEVNLKIFLKGLYKKKIIDDYQPLFVALTNEVCRLVLADNYDQSLCLSLEQLRCNQNPAPFIQLAEHLELAGFLDRDVESFPQAKVLSSRSPQSLTRPELAVLMAASKMYLTRQIENQADWLDEDYCNSYLNDYFPDQISHQYSAYLSGHPLAKEIKATAISNKIINQAGCAFLSRDIDSENSDTLEYVSCYLTFDRVVNADQLRQAIYALDNKIVAEKQYRMLIQVENILANFCQWALSHEKTIRPKESTVACYGNYLESYRSCFIQQHKPGTEGQLEQYLQDGVPAELAEKMVFVGFLADFPLLVSIAIETSRDFTEVLKIFEETVDILCLDKIHERLKKIPLHDFWERKLSKETQQDMKNLTGQIVRNILLNSANDSAAYLKSAERSVKYQRYQRTVELINSTTPTTLLPYIALKNELARL